MGCVGVHFALTDDEVAALRGQPDDEARLNWLISEIEEPCFQDHPERLAESDRAWDAIHRCLTDGRLGFKNGSYPLNRVILGGEALYRRDDFVMSLKTPAEVRDADAALAAIGEEDMRRRYYELDAADYGFELGHQDFHYTWTWFLAVRSFWHRASAAGHYVLFTMDL